MSEPDNQELASGRRAADWLLARLGAGNRSARSGWDGGAVYTFDLGMIAAGLLSFGRLIEDERIIDQGLVMPEHLAHYVNSDRGMVAVAPDGPPSYRRGGWSTTGEAHLVKCVQALLLARQCEAARRLVSRVAATQRPGGRFPTQPRDEIVMLHPHFYTIEGLWIWGTACNDEEALKSAREATAWAWEHQLPSGGMPRYVAGREPGPEQLDVTSQAVRAAILLGVEPPGLEAATSRLAALARADGEHGSALIYQPDADAVHLNAWVTMFAGQALKLAGEGPQSLDWKGLV